MIFGIRWCSCSALDSGRPTRIRFTNAAAKTSFLSSESRHARLFRGRPRTVASIADANVGEAHVHVVVVGCGRVGSELAGSLEKAGHTVAIIDKLWKIPAK